MADGTTLAKAYVQIMPSADGIGGKLKGLLGGEVSSAGQSAGMSFGGALVGTLGKVIAAAGIGKMIKDAISAGGELEQSIGGIETLFGAKGAKSVQEYADAVGKAVSDVKGEFETLMSSQETMLSNAQNAYRTAGISANEYMQTATTFGAALLQGLGGDTVKAAEVTDLAIQDMSDNWNKFGTNQQDIMNAYKGFSKQNYTMLDNLKLGYGGTKTEMERLLADAEKLSGVKYDISNLSDVYNAIHVIQGELGVTGTTAKEASSTLEGSASAMKAAFQNLLGNLAIGADIGPSMEALTTTVGQYLTNLLGMVGNLLHGLPALLTSALSGLTQGLDFIGQNADQIVNQGMELIMQLINGIVTGLPGLITKAAEVAVAFAQALINYDWIGTVTELLTLFSSTMSGLSGSVLADGAGVISSLIGAWLSRIPDILSIGQQIVSGLVSGISQFVVNVVPAAAQIINQLVSGLLSNQPNILNSGVQMIHSLIEGITSMLPTLGDGAANIISSFIGSLMTNFPSVVESGLNLILELIKGIVSGTWQVQQAGLKIALEAVKSILTHAPDFGAAGIKLIGDLIVGIIDKGPDVIMKIADMISKMIDKFKSTDWASVGKNVIEGIIKGIKDAASKLIDAIKDVVKRALEAAKEKLGIKSPSRVFANDVGKFIPPGIALGVKKNSGALTDAMNELSVEAAGQINTGLFSEISGQIETGVSLRNENNGIIEKLEEVENLLTRYIPELAKRQLVLDSGVLVGELVNPLDRALGDLSRLRQRL